MSLGSDSPNQALDDAVTAVIALGITAVIAAGNYNQGRHCQIVTFCLVVLCMSLIVLSLLTAVFECQSGPLRSRRSKMVSAMRSKPANGPLARHMHELI